MNKKPCEANYNIFFTNLANPLKISIILSLRDGEKKVGEVTQLVKGEQSKISHALASLKKCKIVDVKQNGKERIYSLNKKTILPIFDLIDKHAIVHCKGKCSCGVGK